MNPIDLNSSTVTTPNKLVSEIGSDPYLRLLSGGYGVGGIDAAHADKLLDACLLRLTN